MHGAIAPGRRRSSSQTGHPAQPTSLPFAAPDGAANVLPREARERKELVPGPVSCAPGCDPGADLGFEDFHGKGAGVQDFGVEGADVEAGA